MKIPTYPLLRQQMQNIQTSFGVNLLIYYQKELKSTIESCESFNKMFIVGDIVGYPIKEGGISKYEIKFKCKYGFKIIVDNLNDFLDYCVVHRFIPIVDKINIDGRDISDIKQLFEFFLFAVTQSGNKIIDNALWNEIKNLEKSVQYPVKEFFLYLRQILEYTSSTYQYALGNKLQKLRNKGVLSENIFAEIIIKIGEQVRNAFGVQISSVKLAGFRDDTVNKTDMFFIFQKNIHDKRKQIPVQFTISGFIGREAKEDDINKYLQKKIKGKNTPNSFIVLSVNGKFSESMGSIKVNYKNRIENISERENIIGNKIPLFVDTIDYNVIQPAEIMYIALNMIYKKNSFGYTMDEKYEDHVKESIRGYKQSFYIGDNKIELSKIIFDVSIEKIENEEPYPSILKHKFLVSYEGESMGEIVIYEVEQKRRLGKKTKDENDNNK